MRSRASLMAILALIAVVSCAGDDTPRTSASAQATTVTTAPTSASSEDLPTDPCALLTAADLETVTGLPFDEGAFNEDLSQPPALGICDWIGSGEGLYFAQVLVLDQADAFETNKQSAAEALGGVDEVSVPGADDAYATTDGSIVGMRVDDLFLQVSYVPSDPGEILDQTLRIAEVAVSNT